MQGLQPGLKVNFLKSMRRWNNAWNSGFLLTQGRWRECSPISFSVRVTYCSLILRYNLPWNPWDCCTEIKGRLTAEPTPKELGAKLYWKQSHSLGGRNTFTTRRFHSAEPPKCVHLHKKEAALKQAGLSCYCSGNWGCNSTQVWEFLPFLSQSLNAAFNQCSVFSGSQPATTYGLLCCPLYSREWGIYEPSVMATILANTSGTETRPSGSMCESLQPEVKTQALKLRTLTKRAGSEAYSLTGRLYKSWVMGGGTERKVHGRMQMKKSNGQILST